MIFHVELILWECYISTTGVGSEQLPPWSRCCLNIRNTLLRKKSFKCAHAQLTLLVNQWAEKWRW